MSTVKAQIRKPVEETLEYEVTEKVTSNGKSFKQIDSADYTIALFPSRAPTKAGNKSRLAYNAQLTLKQVGVSFQFNVNQLLESGVYIAGGPGRQTGYRAIASQWDGKAQRAWERVAIRQDMYQEIMALINDVLDEDAEEAAE